MVGGTPDGDERSNTPIPSGCPTFVAIGRQRTVKKGRRSPHLGLDRHRRSRSMVRLPVREGQEHRHRLDHHGHRLVSRFGHSRRTHRRRQLWRRGGTTSQVLGTILRQIQVLQTNKTTGTSGASTTYTPPGTETLSGSGYTAPTGKTLVQGATGSTYQYVKTPTQARALLGSGVKLFTQTTPGGFINVSTGNTLGSGTPQFVKVPSKAAG